VKVSWSRSERVSNMDQAYAAAAKAAAPREVVDGTHSSRKNGAAGQPALPWDDELRPGDL
jgi:hypothetical protein